MTGGSTMRSPPFLKTSSMPSFSRTLILHTCAVTGATGVAIKSGYINSELFVKEYLPHFIKHARCSMENHCSHIFIEAVTLYQEFGIVILTLPPHSSHRLPPLDVSCYGPLKNYFNCSMTPTNDLIQEKGSQSMSWLNFPANQYF
ncbi:unnamed protein product [Lepeophtheirus salmonis]|uniref:(salmon louse) hypothetical protein n=1 Tax=Lepeophtheirus salmonis TaxID=72036 RepID=A0A7R8CMT4_LEPSM|nr:unnamed protein product [Lepeophtheirus salmonis]CAF2868094.1 unnamed protein product [Lepeophtheirus salmonis]